MSRRLGWTQMVCCASPAHLQQRPIAAVYPSRRHLSAKVRTFVDFLAERFAREQPWKLD